MEFKQKILKEKSKTAEPQVPNMASQAPLLENSCIPSIPCKDGPSHLGHGYGKDRASVRITYFVVEGAVC